MSHSSVILTEIESDINIVHPSFYSRCSRYSRPLPAALASLENIEQA